MIGHCRDCRWWEQPGAYGPIDWKDTAHGLCDLGTNRAGEGLDHRESKAAASSGGDAYVNVLVTLPDFGCVQFEAKP